ncbi:ATP-grasp domain-containing protein [Streptantibioticus rubrisoli]|uniref:ATP-grasp domain-containing protein n=1 Tax=Streptantibioticus rubrisoli TaxID=1387313 RepID=A0ABT1P910_9ACTN|nr:ATP-grasp domain-containing protein [Streptantibioticus rubrisoli]MCQ4041849.1 ATP-grasp domain-containing protein [Streptantibioticus rubrisoli]
MTEVLLLRSGNPRRLTEPVWRDTLRLCADAGVPVLSTPPDPPGGPEEDLPPGLLTLVPEAAEPDEVAALLAEHDPARIVHCADPDALVRRDVEAARRHRHLRGEGADADRDAAGFDTLLHKGRSRDLCERIGIGIPEGGWGPAGEPLLRRRAATLLENSGRIVLKDPVGWAGRGQSVVRRPQELARALDAMGDRPVVAEAFVSGEEVSVEVLCLGGGAGMVLGWALKGGTDEGGHPLHRLRLAPAGPVPAVLGTEAMRLCAAAGYQGMAEVEFVVGDDGEARVLECNPRVSAISRTFAAANGTSSTELAVRSALYGADGLPEPARLETAERVLPASLPPDVLAGLAAAPGVAWVHPVTDAFQPRVLLGGVAGEGQVDRGVRQLARLTGIDLAEPLEGRRATARRLTAALDGFQRSLAAGNASAYSPDHGDH